MDRPPQGCAPISQDPLPFVRGLFQLIPEQRLAAILTRTAKSSERRRRLPADSVIWLVIAMALFAADSIPKVWRRLFSTAGATRAACRVGRTGPPGRTVSQRWASRRDARRSAPP
jgi:Insertion element 4 transposase N-terminal